MFQIFMFFLILMNSVLFAGENWPQFRGPNGDGKSDATGLPILWSETNHIKWKTEIHDKGWSTPVIWGNQVWLTTAAKDGTKYYAVACDVTSGKILYDLLVFTEEKPQGINDLNSYATPSPVIEEGRVFVHFGTFGTACIDTKTGKKLWERRDMNCDHLQGPASSPIIYKNLLILHLEGTDVQFVIALDKLTGKTIWKTDRPAEIYNASVQPLYKKAYTTPIVINVNGTNQLISVGAQAAFAYHPMTGKEIWRVIYGFDSTISCPVYEKGLVYINTGWDIKNVYLWAVSPFATGDLTDKVKWKYGDNVAGESSPIVDNGLLYMVDDRGAFSCLDAVKGEKIWEKRFNGKFGASPVLAENNLYFCNKKGACFVLQAGKMLKQLAVNQLDAGIWASPAISGKALFIRTETHLYKIQN